MSAALGASGDLEHRQGRADAAGQQPDRDTREAVKALLKKFAFFEAARECALDLVSGLIRPT